MPYTAIEEVQAHIIELIELEAGNLGVRYVGDGSERLVPKYPAVLVEAGPTQTEVHSTHKFQHTFFVIIWVYHADITKTKRARNQDDLVLVTEIKKILHADISFGGNLSDGWVTSQQPGVINRPTGETIVGTRMEWSGRGQEAFK